jgi:hypothetical protein
MAGDLRELREQMMLQMQIVQITTQAVLTYVRHIDCGPSTDIRVEKSAAKLKNGKLRSIINNRP